MLRRYDGDLSVGAYLIDAYLVDAYFNDDWWD